MPLLYLGGYLSFLYHFGIPAPSSLFNLAGVPGGSGGLFPYQGYNILPFGAFGLTGLIVFRIISSLGSAASMAQVPRTRNFGGGQMPPNFMNPLLTSQGLGPEKKLPDDISQTQYVILKQFRTGISKPKNIAKNLAMEKEEVENQIGFLKTNGYITANNKLSPKAVELFYS